MGRDISPTHKLSRREGRDLFGNGGASLERRLGQLPGAHGRSQRRTQSEYARQLREKQKVKRMYGMREAQFRRFFQIAQRTRGETGAALLALLEARLDNVLYRLGLAHTRLQARQFVRHGHVLVDGQRVDIPSYCVTPGQQVEVSPRGRRIPTIQDALAAPLAPPAWLDPLPAGGRILRAPYRIEIDADINERAIVEFYSR